MLRLTLIPLLVFFEPLRPGVSVLITPLMNGLLPFVRNGFLQRDLFTAKVTLHRVSGLAGVGREVLCFDIQLLERRRRRRPAHRGYPVPRRRRLVTQVGKNITDRGAIERSTYR